VPAYGLAMTTETKDEQAAVTPAPGRAAAAKERQVATPWGATTLVAQVAVAQRAGERRFTSVVQLLADGRGEPLVRFAYATAGTARRGPVTLRARDLERLRQAAAKEPALAAMLGWETPAAAREAG
jgi:hypothetical protein